MVISALDIDLVYILSALVLDMSKFKKEHAHKDSAGELMA